MRNVSKVQRAAMGALVAAALMAGVQQANAANRRIPMDDPGGLFPYGRVKIVADAGGGLRARVQLMLSSVRRLPDDVGSWIRRLPATPARRDD